MKNVVRLVGVVVLGSIFEPAFAVDNGIGLTPPMGWRVSLTFEHSLHPPSSKF